MKKAGGKPTRQGKSWGDDDEEEVESEVREPKFGGRHWDVKCVYLRKEETYEYILETRDPRRLTAICYMQSCAN
jgi:hypothetical protein